MEEQIRYYEYDQASRLVVRISYDELTPSMEGYAIAYGIHFEPGDEFTYAITLTEINDEGQVLMYSSVLNNPNAKRLLQENEELKRQQALMQAALDELILGGAL